MKRGEFHGRKTLARRQDEADAATADWPRILRYFAMEFWGAVGDDGQRIRRYSWPMPGRLGRVPGRTSIWARGSMGTRARRFAGRRGRAAWGVWRRGGFACGCRPIGRWQRASGGRYWRGISLGFTGLRWSRVREGVFAGRTLRVTTIKKEEMKPRRTRRSRVRSVTDVAETGAVRRFDLAARECRRCDFVYSF